jgi:polysaccharide deacetylase 2 family uncharacterized protein YibQ
VIKELDRPLGYDRREKPLRSPRRPAVSQILAGLVAAAIVGVGGYIALLPDPFRTPEVVADVGAEPAEAAPVQIETAAAPAQDTRPVHPGPAIIKVDPDATPNGASDVIVIRDPSALGQDLRVAHLPDRALLEQSEMGPLPVRAADGRRAAEVYARPWSGARGARVAIVIGGLGLSQTGTQEAIAKLPSEVTLAFAPQGNSIGRWMQTARGEGHEIMMQLPLEPFDYPRINPGRNTLTTEAEPSQNVDNLHWVLSRTTNYTGVMNYMGARFTSEREAFAPIMAEIGRRGLLYLDDGSSARSLAAGLAAESDVPFAEGDAIIDQDRDRGAILKRLDELEATARARGFAIGTGTAFGETVDAVASWVREARRRGIEIVPVSALALQGQKG